MFWRHPVLTVLALAYLGFVFWLTLTPAPFDTATYNMITVLLKQFHQYNGTAWITYSVLERGANVALFIPVGGFFLLLLGQRHWLAAIVLGIGLSVGIETIQYFFLPTRVADPMDVVTNGTGAIIGVILTGALTWRSEYRHRLIREQQQELVDARSEIARLSQHAGAQARQ